MSVQRRRRSRITTVLAAEGGPCDRGNAVVEFLGAALILLVPTVYLVLVMAQLQAAAFAVDGAAREAVRVFVAADDEVSGRQRAVAAAALALEDQGIDPAGAGNAVTLTCPEPCLAVGSVVTATVDLTVPLPGVPGWLQDRVPLTVPVRADATGAVDTYIGRG